MQTVVRIEERARRDLMELQKVRVSCWSRRSRTPALQIQVVGQRQT